MAPRLASYPVLDALEMAAILRANRARWGWDDKYTVQVVGKLIRGGRSIQPLDQEAASTIVAMCREGWGMYHALKRAGVTQRRFFAWVARSHSADADGAPYRDFRDRVIAAFAQLSAEKGVNDPDSLRRMALG